MLLTIDVGNTNITLGVYDEDELKGSFRMTTKMQRTSDELGLTICQMLILKAINPDEIDQVIISSVVPKIMHSLTNAVRKSFQVEPMIINSEIKSGISVNTENPSAVGADRIVNCAAALKLYGGNCLIIDFGTATTYDYVSKDGVFEYTIISPGLEISAQALYNMAAKLPEVEIKKPASVLGRNTIQGMQSGIVYGYVGQVEYLIKKIREELKTDFTVIATGGLGRVISETTDTIDVYDPDLAFKGMKIIYDMNK